MKNKSIKAIMPQALVNDIRSLIENARGTVASAVNFTLTMLYWKIGKRIRDEILCSKRAAYGEQIIMTLSAKLQIDYGDGFSKPNLSRMLRFSEQFADLQIVSTLSKQLSWSHFVLLIPMEDDLKREFYAEMCRVECWSVRTLRQKIDSMLFERTAISKKPEELIKKELADLRETGKVSPDLVFRDPYVLDFLNLKDTFSESDLESAILHELEHFLLELGSGFAFVSRQMRMTIDGEDHSLDLLFFHRQLKRLVAIELKLGKFKAAYKGQMELYLRWLEKHSMTEGEDTPLGLILCSEGSRETVELLQLNRAGIRVAEYLTELPPKKELEKKLHAVIAAARAQLENRQPE
ncbi:MAG: PDDEXK nuclease domain-containing protein [Candidatus Wallbacteria bacterium]|nr:PDDEXK nuclease domain-containing protein [Candidatus Wallbacteria bacterium]